MKWTIKQAAKKTGISSNTLRYYDKEGVLSPSRHENGYRYYDEVDIMLLKNIVVMKYAKFSLAEMKIMGGLFRKEPSKECNQISQNILNAKIKQLNHEICNYRKIISLMEKLTYMMDSVDEYIHNKEDIGSFIHQIFDDIHNSD